MVKIFPIIIKDIKFIIGSLANHSFSHTRRQGNSFAHALAKRVRLSFPLIVWMKFVPLEIVNFFVFNACIFIKFKIK